MGWLPFSLIPMASEVPVYSSQASRSVEQQQPFGQATKRVAYLMSRFPSTSETFILYEMLELERQGVQVTIFPLVRQQDALIHPGAEPLVARAHYPKLLSWATLAAQVYWFGTRPRRYLAAWWRALLGNIRSRKFFSRALIVVPTAARFAQQMELLQIEHLHAHWATHPALAAYVVHILTGLPYSITAHAHDIYVEQTMLAEKVTHARFIATISEYNRQFLRQLYGEAVADKTFVIHCGIDPTVFEPRPLEQPDAIFTIICVARLEERKGHRYLLEACAQLQQEGIAFRCLIVGEGPQRVELETSIQNLGLQSRVQLLGAQPRQRVVELLGSANVMVLPSITAANGKKEGIPVALMEGMAMQLPVIATNQSGIPELVEPEVSGLLVPERDSVALGTALQRLYHDKDLQIRLAEAGRHKVLQEFCLSDQVARLRHLLQQ